MKSKYRSFKCGRNTLRTSMTKPPVRPVPSSKEPVQRPLRSAETLFVTEVPMTARAPGTRESVTRSREERRKLVEVVDNPDMSGREMCRREVVNGEVLNFKFWGNLRESKTEVKNTLPSFKTIEKEKLAIEFDRTRRSNPDGVAYKEFYEKFYDSKYS